MNGRLRLSLAPSSQRQRLRDVGGWLGQQRRDQDVHSGLVAITMRENSFDNNLIAVRPF